MAVRDHFRAHARRRVDLRATLRERRTAEEQEVRIRDLGLGGACIELAPGVGGVGGAELDAMVTLELTAPTLWDPLPLRGTIAWVRRGSASRGVAEAVSGAGRPTRAGMRFEHHDAGPLYALYQLLGTHAYDL